MATVNKDFKVKAGLVVEGASGTINGYSVLTEAQASIDFIVNTIGGTATSASTPNTVVKRDENSDFSAGVITADIVGSLTGDVTGNSDTSTALETPRTISVSGDAVGSVSFDGTSDVSIAITLDSAFATDVEVGTSKSEAVTEAASYTDGEISTLETSLQSYADLAQSDAETSAASYTDARESAITSAYQSYTDTAEADANTYADSAIAALIGGAPELLDTLNELAEAIADDQNFSATVVNDIAAGLVTAKDYTDTREGLITTAYQGYADTAEADAISTAASDATAKADTAESEANSYTDTEIATEVSSRNTAITTAVDALDTDAIEEGSSNFYFTDERAQDAVAASIAAGSHQNITVTYDDALGSLTLVAENGVADSDTDDLVEGSTNLYFSSARAVAALEAVVPNFTEVDLNSVATQVAATQTVSTASQVVGYSFSGTSYRTAEFVVKSASGVHTEVSKVLLTLDTANNISITEYGVVGTNGSLSTLSAGMDGNTVQLLVTTLNNGTDVTVVGTLVV
jgi:hypothetical protein